MHDTDTAETARAENGRRAKDYDELKELNELVKAGKLYAVEKWIEDGGPLNLPVEKPKRAMWRSPMRTAISTGFHSLVELLVRNGAELTEPHGYEALTEVLRARRLDLVELLLDNGADVHSVTMEEVFETWQPEIMEVFIERGADVDTGNPLAYALCERIRTALRILKRYGDRFPSFQEQANIALRHHCWEGNAKWVSLMLWAGADPNFPGPHAPDEDPDPENDCCALELAAICGHFEIFNLRNLELDPSSPLAPRILRCAAAADTTALLVRLLRLGFAINDQTNGGSSLYRHILERMSWPYTSYRPRSRNHDTEESREKLKMIHLIAKRGAKWIPEVKFEQEACRRCLLQMTPDYTAELVWILAKYRATTRPPVVELLRTPSIRRHVRSLAERIDEMVATLPEEWAQQDSNLRPTDYESAALTD